MAVKFTNVRIPEPLYRVIAETVTHSHCNMGVSAWVSQEIIISLKVLATHKSYDAKKINEALKESGVEVNGT